MALQSLQSGLQWARPVLRAHCILDGIAANLPQQLAAALRARLLNLPPNALRMRLRQSTVVLPLSFLPTLHHILFWHIIGKPSSLTLAIVSLEFPFPHTSLVSLPRTSHLSLDA